VGYEGSLAKSPFPEVLQHIARTSETGILTLQGQDEIIGVTFLDGDVVSVDAVNQAPEDGLGHVLEEEGLVPRDAFSGLVAENQAGGGRVVDLLVERGYLTRAQLLEAMRRQTLRLCAEACSWKQGQFRFYRGDQVSYEHGIEPINVDELLARLAGDGPTEPKGTAKKPMTLPRPVPAAPPRFGVLRPPEPTRAPVEEAQSFAIEMPDYEPLDVPEVEVLSPGRPALDPRPVEMPDVEYWSEMHGGAHETPRKQRKPWFDFQKSWGAVVAPLLPGRLLGIGMLVGIAGLLVLAPARFLVPLDSQERIRSGFTAAVQSSIYDKVDQAAKTFFLVRGEFPSDLGELVSLSLLANRDTQLPDARRLSYTEAPVSYLLAIEGEARVESAIKTETISGNFLLDPDFSPAELVDSPPLVLLD
jgi:Domain of unknown function (DUF4388)